MTENTPLLLTVKGTTDAAGWPRTTTYRLLRERKISGVKVGRRTLISFESLQAYVKTLPKVGAGR